jgi:hypothetical protein
LAKERSVRAHHHERVLLILQAKDGEGGSIKNTMASVRIAKFFLLEVIDHFLSFNILWSEASLLY